MIEHLMRKLYSNLHCFWIMDERYDLLLHRLSVSGYLLKMNFKKRLIVVLGAGASTELDVNT